jgi:tetratricopeptide (TPR) repeat protein
MRAPALALVVLATVAAHAEPDRESRARAHYEVGLGMYNLGNYADAVREFSAGYALSPRPQFLINLGQAYRKLHELDRAAEMYRKYLSVAPADAKDRADVRNLLDEVEAERAHAPPATAQPPPPPSSPATNAPAATTAPTNAPATAEPVAPALVAGAPPPPRASGLRRWWWTIPVSAVVVGAAVGVTLYFTLRSSDVACGSATIACVDLRP